MIKKIGVLTSGGDAPGMNAAIRGVVRAALTEKPENGKNSCGKAVYHVAETIRYPRPRKVLNQGWPS